MAVKKQYRRTAIIQYAGDPPKCACCGDRHYKFLCIDHINNDGGRHRLELNNGTKRGGYAVYQWLIKNNFPDGYQVLCYNCNQSKWYYGICPHKEE